MKCKGIFFIFFMGFVLVNGFCQKTADDAQLLKDIIRSAIREEMNTQGGEKPPGNHVILTWDIVKMLIENDKKGEFKNLGFFLSSNLSLTSKPNSTIKTNSSALVIDDGNKVTTERISKTSKGEYVNYFEKTNEESFLIKFPEFKQSLQFVRNAQTNRFEFYAVDGGIKYSFEKPRPYLCIYLEQKGEVSLQSGAPVRQDGHSRVPVGMSGSDLLPWRIMGNGKLNRDVAVSYIMSKSPVVPRHEIVVMINEYIMEAAKEGIDHDIAIAQMCYATRFLNNRQLLSTHNYAGLNTDMGISVKHGGRHASIQEGVWAHIQHLKGYASRECPRREIVNQRYYYLANKGILGTVTTLDALFVIWSPYNSYEYGNEIKRILRELYQFSNVYKQALYS